MTDTKPWSKGAGTMPRNTKPRNAQNMNRANVRDAGEVARQATRMVVTTDVLGCSRQDVDQAHAIAILTAWRREIESAMVERIARHVDDWGEEEFPDPDPNSLADAIRSRFGGGQ